VSSGFSQRWFPPRRDEVPEDVFMAVLDIFVETHINLLARQCLAAGETDVARFLCHDHGLLLLVDGQVLAQVVAEHSPYGSIVIARINGLDRRMT
jgi:hypothetical protein